MGIIGVLLQADDLGLLDSRAPLRRLLNTNFRLSRDLRKRVLERVQSRT
ncbi:DUF3368 domain-containing protein [Terriglobus sp.]